MTGRMSHETRDKLFERVFELTKNGHSVTTACVLAGLNPKVFRQLVTERNLTHLLPPKRSGSWEK